jgi:hypothetical protein
MSLCLKLLCMLVSVVGLACTLCWCMLYESWVSTTYTRLGLKKTMVFGVVAFVFQLLWRCSLMARSCGGENLESQLEWLLVHQ